MPNGVDASDGLELGRLARLRKQLELADCDAGIFYDPTNIRYATGVSNMQVYSLHNPCRYVYVPVNGPVVLFDFKGCEHLSDAHRTVDEVRNAVSWYHFITGPRTPEFAAKWADEIVGLLHRDGAQRRPRLAVDRLDPYGLHALAERDVDVVDGQEVANFARVIKTPEEIVAIELAMAACDTGIATMRDALMPGITEQELWSELHRSNIALGGEWFETRLLTSGPRTNPWYQECADRVIEAGDLVAFDTDLIGIGGYSIDVSRTWIAGDAEPTAVQSEMYAAAYEQVSANIELLRPGLSFRDFVQQATLPPSHLHSPTNAALAHGIGLCNEYPLILNRDLFDDGGYDGVIEENMVLCIESLVAPVGGAEAVKLEQQVVVGADGARNFSATPFTRTLAEPPNRNTAASGVDAPSLHSLLLT
jgi:Xaa-Pro dipeptidase